MVLNAGGGAAYDPIGTRSLGFAGYWLAGRSILSSKL